MLGGHCGGVGECFVWDRLNGFEDRVLDCISHHNRSIDCIVAIISFGYLALLVECMVRGATFMFTADRLVLEGLEVVPLHAVCERPTFIIRFYFIGNGIKLELKKVSFL